MLYHVTEFVARLWRETSVIRKAVKLLDNLIASTDHVLFGLIRCDSIISEQIKTILSWALIGKNNRLFLVW